MTTVGASAGTVSDSGDVTDSGTPEWCDEPTADWMLVEPPSAWRSTGDDTTWECGPLRASLRVFHSYGDDDGAALFSRLTAAGPADVGRPDVHHLPDELADGVLVVRREFVDGCVSVRLDAARRLSDVEILLSARLPDPATADDAVQNVVQLLAAVDPSGQHERVGRGNA